MNVQTFVDNIREEKEGFEFGKPWRYNSSSLAAIVPIIRNSKEPRQYVTLAEAGDKVFIEDSGSISEAIVTNKGDKPVFIRAGEMLKGSTQTRAVTISRIVMPKQTATLKIVCVYASKGIRTGAKFSSAGYAPSSVENTIINEAHKTNGAPNQSNVWNSVHVYSTTIASGYADPLGTTPQKRTPRYNIRSATIDRVFTEPSMNNNNPSEMFYGERSVLRGQTLGYASSKTDDLEGSMKQFSMTMQELFKSLPKVDWQVGAALLGITGLEGLEVFDLPDSWTAMKESLAEKEAENLVKKDQENAFEFNPEKAKGMVTKVLAEKFSEKDLYKDEKTRTIAIDLPNLVGQVTVLGDTIIHLNLTKKTN